MPAGMVHRRDSRLIGIAFGATAITYMLTDYYVRGAPTAFGPALVSIASGAGIVGQFMTPDWDQEANAEWWYLPYAEIMPHRSAWSHVPYLSTYFRYKYVSTLLFIAGYLPLLAYSFFTTETNAIRLLAEYIGWWRHIMVETWVGHHIFWHFIGTSLSDAAHWARDGFPSKVNYEA